MYRPEGWRNFYNKDSDVSSVVGLAKDLSNAYEAGADAILEELKKDEVNSEYCTAGNWIETCASRWNEETQERDDISGTWVFIPEEI